MLTFRMFIVGFRNGKMNNVTQHLDPALPQVYC